MLPLIQNFAGQPGIGKCGVVAVLETPLPSEHVLIGMNDLKIAEPALVILAATILAFPEARSVPIRLAVAFSWAAVTPPDSWSAYRNGTLRMTPCQIYSTVNDRPRTSLLSVAAAVIGSITDARAPIWDADDVMAAVENARVSGSPDGKRWAAEAMRECHGFVADERKDSPEVQKIREESRAVESADVRKKRESAFGELARRCRGLKDMPVIQRRAVLAELRTGAQLIVDGNTTPLRTLKSMDRRLQNSDSRWNSVEAQTLNDALYGDDRLLRRSAFLTLDLSIDVNAPGGAERRDALLFAMASDIVNPPPSTFESLERCGLIGLCEDTSPVTSSAETPPDVRLVAAYRDAFARRLSFDQILAIR